MKMNFRYFASIVLKVPFLLIFRWWAKLLVYNKLFDELFQTEKEYRSFYGILHLNCAKHPP